MKYIMNEENKIGYYAIIPATVLFNEKIKANEKLLYAIITVLSNKEGYCYASNGYLGRLLNAKPHTVSKWVSHLKELEFFYFFEFYLNLFLVHFSYLLSFSPLYSSKIHCIFCSNGAKPSIHFMFSSFLNQVNCLLAYLLVSIFSFSIISSLVISFFK